MMTQTAAGATTPVRIARTSRKVMGLVRHAPVLPILIILTVLFVAVFADVLAPHDPEVSVKTAAGRPMKSYLPPFWMHGGSLTTPLGTDFHSRDILSRLVYGARVSLLVGVLGTLVAGALGTTLGVLAGIWGAGMIRLSCA